LSRHATACLLTANIQRWPQAREPSISRGRRSGCWRPDGSV